MVAFPTGISSPGGEVAAFLKLSASTIYGLLAACLPSVKIDKSRRIPHRAVVDFAARRLVSRIGDPTEDRT